MKILQVSCVLFCVAAMAGCATGRYEKVNYVKSVRVNPQTPVQGVTYHLPQTALKVTAKLKVLDYDAVYSNGTTGKFRTIEPDGEIKIEPLAMPDPDFTYWIEAERVAKNAFTYSNLTFGLSEQGLLTSATADIKDKRLAAAQSAVKLFAGVAKLALSVVGGAPAASLMEASGPAPATSGPVTLGKSTVVTTVDFSTVVSVAARKTAIPVNLKYLAETYDAHACVQIALEVGDRLPGTDSSKVPEKLAERVKVGELPDSIFYRKSLPFETTLRAEIVANDTNYTLKDLKVYETSSYLPYAQFGPTHTLPVGGKPWTDRTTTLTFDSGGGLASYGVTSESSADKVLDTANTAVTDISAAVAAIQQQIAALEKAQQEAENQQRADTVDRIKKLKALADCIRTAPGSGCKAEWDAVLTSVGGGS